MSETQLNEISLDYDEQAEEIYDRYELEVEDCVAEFIDEHSIRHDIIPDSDNEEEETAMVYRGSGYLRHGMTFISGVAFKEAVLDYVLKNGENLRQNRWDTNKIAYCCGIGGGCEWRVYASLVKKSGLWEIKKLNTIHTCIPNGSCVMFKVPVIARLFVDKIRQEPDVWQPMKIQEYIMQHWKLNATDNQCQAARKKALKWLEKEYANQFAHLKYYGDEILHSNPGSTVDIGTIPNGKGDEVFQRFYVCFNGLKKSWMENCRRILGVDGCFIKTEMKGQVLVAVGRDADNRIYPVAWGVVQVENADNWEWFVKKIKSDLLLGNGEGFIIVSDRQKGLIKAVEAELPKIEHRMCVRHIYANLKSNHGKKDGMMKPLIWNMAWSYNEADYAFTLNRIKDYNLSIYRDVVRSNPKSWCRAFYKIGNFCEDVDNNFTEAFNSTLVRASEKAFVPMLETIRRLAMVRNSKRSDKAVHHIGVCTPYVTNILKFQHEKAAMCKIYRSSNGYHEVILDGENYRLHMGMKTCSCRKWEIRGIPCEHAYGVILSKKLNVADYVASCFHTETWRKTYASSILPLRGAQFWCKGDTGLVIQPEVPAQPGRKKQNKNKKNKRRREVNESPTKNGGSKQRREVNESPTKNGTKVRRTSHCKKCGLSGHNSRTCGKSVGKETASQNEEGTQEMSTQSQIAQEGPSQDQGIN